MQSRVRARCMIAHRADEVPAMKCHHRRGPPPPAARCETAPSPPRRGFDRGGSIAWLASSDDRDSIDRGAGSSNTSVHDIADGPQYRLHKGSGWRSKAASGFNPSRGPGSGLHRIALQYGRRRQWSNWPDRRAPAEKSRPRGTRPGCILQECSISRRRRSRCAGACRDGFRPSAVAGSRSSRCRHRRRRSRRRWRDPSHSRGPSDGRGKSRRRSGRCSGNGERGGGDQSEGHLAKHRKYSPIDWREAVVASLPISRTDASCVHARRGESCFRNVSWREICGHPFDPDNHVAPSGSVRPWPG